MRQIGLSHLSHLKKYSSTVFINNSLSSILFISHLNSLEFGIFLVYHAMCFLISLIAVTSGLFSNSSSICSFITLSFSLFDTC